MILINFIRNYVYPCKGSFNRNEAYPSIFAYNKIMLNYLLQKIKQN